MDALAVPGVLLPRTRADQWVWLYVHADDHSGATQLCIGKTPLTPTTYAAIPPFRHPTTAVKVEVWTSASAEAAFMAFVGACRIDAAAWTADDSCVRWYELSPKTEHTESSCVYRKIAPENDEMAAFIGIVPTFARRKLESPPVPQEPIVEVTKERHGFQFTMPHKVIRRRALLRRSDIREVAQQCQLDVLDQLFPSTLYGKLIDDQSLGHELQKALILLQLSCQYAFHTTDELKKHRRDMESQLRSLHYRKASLLRSKVMLKERRSNLTQERDALDKALDSMKTILRELDPETSPRK